MSDNLYRTTAQRISEEGKTGFFILEDLGQVAGKGKDRVASDLSLGAPPRSSTKLISEINRNAQFIEDLIRIGCAAPEDIAHMVKIVTLDAGELKCKDKNQDAQIRKSVSGVSMIAV